MNQKQLERWGYEKPECEIIETSTEQFICVSVRPEPKTSTEEDWDADQEVDGGDIYI
ncbi:hypothetical protein [Hoylesella enoeca]|uniref:Fatty-acid--CoA ligase n=1 Tax=Hoylesella enoeca TaxID=76123 RepID=A0A0S2KLM8_9BACT|nr:hypothetical protein [Hoylesella enoeca]ALO48980.1 fatty-acid--CoA ligase [Hoylesella enoeca]